MRQAPPTSGTPYPEEIKGWQSQRSAMIAEVGSLKAEVIGLKRALLDTERDRDRCLAAVVESGADRDRLRSALATAERERDEARRTGIDECIEIVRGRQRHYELYRHGDAMKTHPATFAIIEELLVFLQSHRERSIEPREPGDGYCQCGERLDKEHHHGI